MKKLPSQATRKLQEETSPAYDHIFKQFYKFAYATAFFILKDEEETEDLVQAFFIDLWEKQMYLALNDDIKGYLYRAVKNRALNHIRNKETERRRREVFYLYSERDSGKKEDTEEYLLRLKEALCELPVQRREAIQMVYLNDKKYQEAAEVMGISVNSLKTHLKIGLKNLRSRMKGYNDE